MLQNSIAPVINTALAIVSSIGYINYKKNVKRLTFDPMGIISGCNKLTDVGKRKTPSSFGSWNPHG